jgi:Galactose oxidase, central domain
MTGRLCVNIGSSLDRIEVIKRFLLGLCVLASTVSFSEQPAQRARPGEYLFQSRLGTGDSPVAHRFVLTGSLSEGRIGHTGTLLPTGRVLLAGGFNAEGGGAYLDSAQLYNAAKGTFTATGSLITRRVYHTATRLQNGKVLIVGGVASPTSFLASAELYDPNTGTFSSTGNMSAARFFHTATLLANGMVLIAGGWSTSGPLSSAELYDPSLGAFTPTGSLNVARGSHTATLLQDGTVLIAAGVMGDN